MAVEAKYTMHHSAVLDADPDTVWAEVRDAVNVVKILFGDTVENVGWTDDGAPERVPSRYNFTLLPAQALVQQQVAGRNELDRSLTYRSVARAVCLYDYVATYRVLPVSGDPGRSYLEYQREFKITDDAVPEVVDALMDMMANQINILRDYFATPKQDLEP
ncbi:hypothetical protein [Actinophytocola sp.]|uniref:hypothetical protein n=1 Tax=Actinophytocola sp. TaxID=1872138 RepID=UPI002D810BBF|nr:hypothetical protein [Actinophytocola sp.]HET9139153.1 hypothetical protein [Actinophytocola sp.]